MHIQNPQKLIDKYVNGTASLEERILLESFINKYLERDVMLPKQKQLNRALYKNRTAVFSAIKNNTSIFNTHSVRVLMMSAAALLIVGIGLMFTAHTINFGNPFRIGKKGELGIRTGYNRATLTLADGRRISLDSTQEGIIVDNKDIKYQSGKPITDITNRGFTQALNKQIELTLSTPMGGQYQIILPDGTKVWLNAATKIQYPSTFKGAEQRQVKVVGEAYFEVSNNEIPFSVIVGDQTVRVLGTKFQVTHYDDESIVKTTLASGSVQVSENTNGSLGNSAHQTIRLQPGEQSILPNGGKLIKKKVDISNELAWKDGFFSFNQEPLESIMRKISRWYDLDIKFNSEEIKKFRLGGKVSKFSRVSEVIEILELTKLAHFRIEGRTIMVSK